MEIVQKIYVPHHNTMVEFIQNLERLGVNFVVTGKAVIMEYGLDHIDSVWKRANGTFIVATGYCPHEDKREWCEEQDMTSSDWWTLRN